MIPYGRQDITEEDVVAVSRALRDPLITQGPRVAAFEEALALRVGARYAVAFSSGTAALHGAYFAAGVGPGKSVLTSPITFVATANASLYLGGGVAFADVDADSALIDPHAVESARRPDTAVLAPVHFGGQVADLETLAGIALRRGWLVIEDAAHALGASYTTRDGREYRVGACAHSAMCCFSFHPVKHVTTGEGGAVTTNDPAYYETLRRFRSHGITREPSELTVDEGPWYYEQHDLGYNYRLTDFQCALGMRQLERLDEFVERRIELAGLYDRRFRQVRGIRPLAKPQWSQGSYHLYVVRVPAGVRRAVFEGLRVSGIGANVHYIPVYRQPYYRARGFSDTHLQGAERYYASAITIPLFAAMTDSEVEQVVMVLSEQLAATGRG